MEFYKYQGTGNDFIMIDNRTKNINLSTSEIEILCDRNFGIGADGLILLENETGYNFKMVYYNSDGNESSMCGNGGRCIAMFANHLDIGGETKKFLAIDGEHSAGIDNDVVLLAMKSVTDVQFIDNDYYVLNTGSPHLVKFVVDLDLEDFNAAALEYRNLPQFLKEGINVNFVLSNGINDIEIRTFERGVEDETLSCGTGAVACAIANIIHHKGVEDIHNVSVGVEGGDLEINFLYQNNQFSEVFLIGKATKVFEGAIDLNSFF